MQPELQSETRMFEKMQEYDLIRLPKNGRQRVVIEQVWPEIDCGQFPVKRCINDEVTIEATIFADGHDQLAALLKYRHIKNSEWQLTPFYPSSNDRWHATFTVTEIGEYFYTISAWVDEFRSWRYNLQRRIDAKQEISTELLIGIHLVETAKQRATPNDANQLELLSSILKTTSVEMLTKILATHTDMLETMTRYPEVNSITDYKKILKITVDREKARFSNWYEVFPRSLGTDGQHGSLKDLSAHLPYIAAMGFDVVYLPPIHPIGHTYRKGKNNHPVAQNLDPGSPWGIGASEGGHTAIHPQLGNFDDFQQLLAQAKTNGIEIALDLALQCSPDHPYVTQHPEWFKHRPDGSIQYAENPPKKYQDIYPIYFQSEQWQEIWQEWHSVVLFWVEQGIRIFRVDNPHTKPFSFWQWLIAQIKTKYPEVIFLAEAFTHPNSMYYLAKLGFSQSYTYFTWRNTRQELIEYMTELHQTIINEFLRPNLWPNTPDILHEYLQTGGRPAFITRLLLAATLSASYGIYGPVFELCVNKPHRSGSEEYLNSEKYEIIDWDLKKSNNLCKIITQANQIRRENPCLHHNHNLRFHTLDNEQLIGYSKCTADRKNILVIVANLDPHHTQCGWIHLPLELFGISSDETYVMHDLLDNAKYLWHGARNYVELNPKKMPVHIFKIGPHIRHEQDFKEY